MLSELRLRVIKSTVPMIAKAMITLPPKRKRAAVCTEFVYFVPSGYLFPSIN